LKPLFRGIYRYVRICDYANVSAVARAYAVAPAHRDIDFQNSDIFLLKFSILIIKILVIIILKIIRIIIITTATQQ
jgi:hypothetical protein